MLMGLSACAILPEAGGGLARAQTGGEWVPMPDGSWQPRANPQPQPQTQPQNQTAQRPPNYSAPAYNPPVYNPPVYNPDVAAQPIPATPRSPLAVPAPPKDAANARAAGVYALPSASRYLPQGREAGAALDSFASSCAALMKRNDISGLTQAGDWTVACKAAPSWPRGDATRFFSSYFTPVQVGEGKAHVTGYYEPEIKGVITRQQGYNVPIFGKPSDIIEADLSAFHPDYAGKQLRGKLQGKELVPYDSRAEIEGGSLAGRAPIIAWAADAPEFFFLQIQGSGRLIGPKGELVRIGFASANGRQYKSIGKLLLDEKKLGSGGASMQGIMAYLKQNPADGRRVMQANESYVFFRIVTGDGPLGSLNVAVKPRVSLAADPRFTPLGAPVLLSLDRAEPGNLWIAQDTGGAIKGANRFDSFWGAGDAARSISGGMSAHGSALILLPKPAAARFTAR